MIVKFRSIEEASKCDLTRLGVVSGASSDGLTVEIDDVDFSQWKNDGEDSDVNAIIRASMASCGVWVELTS